MYLESRVENHQRSLKYLLRELEKIDLLIQGCVKRSRDLRKTNDPYQGLYISEDEVDAILTRPIGLPKWVSKFDDVSHDNKSMPAVDKVTEDSNYQQFDSNGQHGRLRLEVFQKLFGLSDLEKDIVLICLAPEIDLRYERLYSYLQDDVTKKRPSVDLVLNLLSVSFQDKLQARGCFRKTGGLIIHNLLCVLDESSHPTSPLLAKYLKIDDRIVDYLLGSDEMDSRLYSCVLCIRPEVRLEQQLLPTETKNRLAEFIEDSENSTKADMVFCFCGDEGVGKQTTAEAICNGLDIELLIINGLYLLGVSDEELETVLSLIYREALLRNAALYWSDFTALTKECSPRRLSILLDALDAWSRLIFVAVDDQYLTLVELQRKIVTQIIFPLPDYAQRVDLWSWCLESKFCSEDVSPSDLASKFRLSVGQIKNATKTAIDLSNWRHPTIKQLSMDDLSTACRLHSNRCLSTLARKITPCYSWGDIVLPPDQLEQLKDICSYINHRALVYGKWGFDRKFSQGKAVNVLFAGSSGTGKTMAVEIIANELNLELYKIDLSMVVSKYIGETEENLARIFSEAETSNAILFFDEADALFGKRSEIKDAHDRYANIETSYLLQRMEEYEGIVILATNFRKNMDNAFARRMAITVTFPFPEQEDRLRIWEISWPSQTPRAKDINLPFLADNFKLAGGNIRNIVLSAAFQAARSIEPVAMKHLVRATRRELQKMGKSVVLSDFAQYSILITESIDSQRGGKDDGI